MQIGGGRAVELNLESVQIRVEELRAQRVDEFRAQRVDEKNAVICIATMFTPRVMVF